MPKTKQAQEMTPADLRQWRESRGYSQTDVEKVLGIPQSTLSLYEAGKRPVPLWLERLIDCYSISERHSRVLAEKAARKLEKKRARARKRVLDT